MIKTTDPIIIALAETKLAENETVQIEGYKSLEMNRNERGGGIMLLIKEELENITVIVEKTTQ